MPSLSKFQLGFGFLKFGVLGGLFLLVVVVGFFGLNGPPGPQICKEIQWTQKPKPTWEKKNRDGDSHLTRFQNLLPSYGNQDGVGLA